MRLTALALLALLAATLVPVGTAQPPTFSEPYQVRAAVGDIPTTDAGESSGFFNVEQRLAVQYDNQSAAADRTYTFFIPAGATLVRAACEACPATRANHTSSKVDFTIEPPTPSGQYQVTVLTRQPVQSAAPALGMGTTFGFVLLASPQAPDGRVVIVYVPTGHALVSDADFASPGASTDGQATIQYATFSASDPMPDALGLAVVPATAVPDAAPGGAGVHWAVPLLAGLVLGAVLWAVLVSRGAVQKRSRKQVAATAAHVEAAAADPPAVLEGKKRALFAALKEVELAKQANEMPVEVYDAVKADLKKQAVTVMRALEASQGEAKA